MSNTSKYKWLIVVEGYSDIKTYEELLLAYGVSKNDFTLFSASGKPNVCNTNTWSTRTNSDNNIDLLSLLQNDLGRIGFKGVLLVVDAVKKASDQWNIPKLGDGKTWWIENTKAKLDKFIYVAFTSGFKSNRQKPALPNEPDVIKNIKKVIGY